MKTKVSDTVTHKTRRNALKKVFCQIQGTCTLAILDLNQCFDRAYRMGRKNKSYSRTLHQQAYDRFYGMLKVGEGKSKKEAIANGTSDDKIFSYATYQTYWKHAKYFIRWVNRNHPECTTLSKARKYVSEWLEQRTNYTDKNGKQLSAWTIQTEAAAVNKLFRISADDPGRFQPPARRRYNITRSRMDTKRDKHFSKSNNAELINFCRGTGCRRNVLAKLTQDDLWTRERMESALKRLQGDPSPEAIALALDLKDALAVFPDQDSFIFHRKDKNGKQRFAPIVGDHKDAIIRRFRETLPGKKVWEYIHSAADVHGYRGDYAMTIYKYYARDVGELPYDRVNLGTGKYYQSQVYICRKDEAGKKLDKAAMLKASKALGHNRLSVVADNYLRGL